MLFLAVGEFEPNILLSGRNASKRLLPLTGALVEAEGPRVVEVIGFGGILLALSTALVLLVGALVTARVVSGFVFPSNIFGCHSGLTVH